MQAPVTRELCEYIWQNYRQLIDRETNYLSKSRALIAYPSEDKSLCTYLQPEDWQYFDWPLQALQAEVWSLSKERRQEVAERVLRNHSSEIELNHCPGCGLLPVAPTSRHCLHCGHSWHGRATSRGEA